MDTQKSSAATVELSSYSPPPFILLNALLTSKTTNLGLFRQDGCELRRWCCYLARQYRSSRQPLATTSHFYLLFGLFLRKRISSQQIQTPMFRLRNWLWIGFCGGLLFVFSSTLGVRTLTSDQRFTNQWTQGRGLSSDAARSYTFVVVRKHVGFWDDDKGSKATARLNCMLMNFT